MNNLDWEKLKEKLLAEKHALEKEIAEEKAPVPEANLEFHDEAADYLEEVEEKTATDTTLEEELKKVDRALAKLADGTYGRCFVCGQEIEPDRLEANPAAPTCKTHREQEPPR